MPAIWMTDDGRLRLDGPYAVEPRTKAQLAIEYPFQAQAPSLSIRFVALPQLDAFNQGRRDGALPYPDDLSPYIEIKPAISAGTPSGASTSVQVELETDEREGVYLCIVTPDATLGGAKARFHVIIANRRRSVFPAPGVDDLADVIVPHVNASDKNGVLWLVDPIFFVEQFLLIKLADAVKAEMLKGPNLPPHWPPDPEQYRLLILGRPLAGVDRVRLGYHSDEEHFCFDGNAARENPKAGGPDA